MKKLLTLALVLLSLTLVSCDPQQNCEDAGGEYNEETGECITVNNTFEG